jgi:hypothetical protein
MTHFKGYYMITMAFLQIHFEGHSSAHNTNQGRMRILVYCLSKVIWELVKNVFLVTDPTRL